MARLNQLKQQLAVPINRRMRMLWNSNGVRTPSGYGIFQRDLLYRLLKDGWEVAQSAFFGLDQGPPQNWDGLTVYPKMFDTYGSDCMVYHAKHFGANVVFSMQDVWTLNPQMLQQIKYWVPYVPIDQEPVPDNILDKLKYAHKIITFSKFGQKALEKRGFSSTLIVEGTDTNIMRPLDKAECRKMFNIPMDKFVVGMVGANKPDSAIPRKGWQEGLEAFAKFHETHPESVFFYHSNQTGGFPIQQFATQRLGLKDCVLFMDEYMAVFHTTSDVMAKMYNCFDVLLHPSTTEGFGLCIVEAMSCGVPVVVNNCTSMPELVVEGVTGEIAETARRHLSPAMGWYYFADVDSLASKLEKIYTGDRAKMGQAARDHVVKNYNIDTIFKEKWIPLMEELQDEIVPLQPLKEDDKIPLIK